MVNRKRHLGRPWEEGGGPEAAREVRGRSTWDCGFRAYSSGMHSEAVLPDEAEIARLVPGPGSITWRRAADARVFLGAGVALVAIGTARFALGY